MFHPVEFYFWSKNQVLGGEVLKAPKTLRNTSEEKNDEPLSGRYTYACILFIFLPCADSNVFCGSCCNMLRRRKTFQLFHLSSSSFFFFPYCEQPGVPVFHVPTFWPTCSLRRAIHGHITNHLLLYLQRNVPLCLVVFD